MVLILVVCLLAIRVWDPLPVASLRERSFDVLQQVLSNGTLSNDIVIVEIDEESLTRIGQWPWPRDRLADLTTRLAGLGAGIVGFDMILAEPDRFTGMGPAPARQTPGPIPASTVPASPNADDVFADAMARVPVLLGLAVREAAAVDAPGRLTTRVGFLGTPPHDVIPQYAGLVASTPALASTAAGQGAIIGSPERDGVARRIPLLIGSGDLVVPHFALEALRLWSGSGGILVDGDPEQGVRQVLVGDTTLAAGADGSIWLRFATVPADRYIPAVDVLNGNVPEGRIADKIVIVGLTAAGLDDVVATPVATSAHGVEVVAQAIHALTTGEYLMRPFGLDAAEVLIAGLIGLLLALGLPRLPAALALSAGVVVVCTIAAAVVYGYVGALVLVDGTWPIVVVVVVFGTSLFFRLTGHESLVRAHAEAVRSYDVFMRQTAENLFDAVVVTDKGGTIVAANPAAARLFAGSEGQLVGSPISDLIGASDPARFASTADLLSSLEGIGTSERKARRLGGGAFDLDLAVTRFDRRREPFYIVVARDISSRRRAEAERDRARRRLEDAIASIDQGFALWDATGDLILRNQAFSRLAPDLEASRIRLTAPDVLGPVTSPDTAQSVAGSPPPAETTPTDGAQDKITREIALPDDRWLVASRQPMSDGGTVVVLSDVTEMKIRENDLTEALMRIETQAADVRRLADDLDVALREARAGRYAAEEASRAKSDFLAMMSHELRTPLNAIIGYSEIMTLETYGDLGNAKYLEYARSIHTSGGKLLSIIEMILDLAKLESGRFDLYLETVDLKEKVSSWADVLHGQAEAKGVILDVDLPYDLPTLHTDPKLVDVIVMNLASNAVKFTPMGGTVALALQRSADNGVVLEVRDTGPGMAERDLERAMIPFVQLQGQLNRQHEGTGLGLPLVKRAAAKLGADFDLSSRPGMGTTARVTFPRALAPPEGDKTLHPAAGT